LRVTKADGPKAISLYAGEISAIYVTNTYKCLLADIRELSGVPLGAPDDISYDWVLIEGPKLDKQLLKFLEGVGTLPIVPEWLKPLMDIFLSSLDGKYLRWIRQLLLFCYKIETEPTNEQIREAQASFESVEDDVANWEGHYRPSQGAPFYSHAQKVVGRVIHKIDWSSIIPSHGPGAVYPSVDPSEKSDFTTIYATIEPHYGFADFMCGLPSFWEEAIMSQQFRIEERDTIECRLIAVPKDSRGPRLICVHPKEAIWIQQGCRRLLERAIMSKRSPCHGRITFNDQGTNGRLALQSSIDREYVTLDLKEASDRISPLLVRSLFGDFAYEKISCSRAQTVRLLDERVIPLRKWAPMGNALTFPVQSLIFYALVQSGILCRYGVTCNDIYVFGDDILFPRKFWDGAVNGLVRAGLVPNMDKTFLHGLFRESCGVDAFNGFDVTPARMRRADVDSVSGAASTCTLAREMQRRGYRLTAEFLYRSVSDCFGLLPLSNNPNAQGIYRYEDIGLDKLLRYEYSTRFNLRTHSWQTRVHLVTGSTIRPCNDAWWHLQDSILRLLLSGEDVVSIDGLEYAVPHRTRLKRGWIDVCFKHTYQGRSETSIPERDMMS